MKIKFLIVALICTVMFLSACSEDNMMPEEMEEEMEEEMVETYNLLGTLTTPEGIAIDQRDGGIYTGGFGDGSIQKTLDGVVEYFIEPNSETLLTNVLGITLDEANDRLWVCSLDFFTVDSQNPMVQVDVLSILDGSKLATYTQDDMSMLMDGFRAFINDVTLDDQGNAYLTNTRTNAILTVPNDLSLIEVFTSDFPEGPNNGNYALNGIEVTPDGQYLITSSFVANSTGVSALFRIGIESRNVSLIPVSEIGTNHFSTTGADGLAFVDENTMLSASLSSSILRIELNSDYSAGEISNVTQGTSAQNPIIGCATLALYDEKVYTTNAQLGTFLGA